MAGKAIYFTTFSPFVNYENQITQLWHKRRCLNYGNIISRSNKIGEFLFRALLFSLLVRFVLFSAFCVSIEYGNVLVFTHAKSRGKEQRR